MGIYINTALLLLLCLIQKTVGLASVASQFSKGSGCGAKQEIKTQGEVLTCSVIPTVLKGKGNQTTERIDIKITAGFD